jgi:hypothetical protein
MTVLRRRSSRRRFATGHGGAQAAGNEVDRSDRDQNQQIQDGYLLPFEHADLFGAAATTFASRAARTAEDWRVKYPELVFACIPEENAMGVVDRWTPFIGYLLRAIMNVRRSNIGFLQR